jgi:hypothetical protein
MSGPKYGTANLNREREAELRRQREREDRIRRAAEDQKRDGKREQSIQQTSREIRGIVQQTQSALEVARKGVVAKYAASELTAWKRQCESAQQEFDQMQAAFNRAQQNFRQATESWKSNNEQYRGGHFDGVDFRNARRALDAVIQEGKRLQDIAETRREEERIQREMERQQAEAQAALLQARTMCRQLEDLPHAALAPGAMEEVHRQIERVNRSIQQQDYPSATQTARQTNQYGMERIREVQEAYQNWQSRYEAARVALEEAQQAMASFDRDFVQTWAQGHLDTPDAQAREITQAFSQAQHPTHDTAPYDHIIQRSRDIQAAITGACTIASERYAEEKRRETIVDAILDVLEGMNFNVGATLSDESDRLSEVMISAGHPSGQEVSMRVDVHRTVHMDMEDGVKGANCVADVYNLIEGLQDAGIELEMTDWGYADPDRVKRGGTYFKTGRGTQQRKSGQ